MVTFSAECMIGNSTQCGRRLECLYVALGVCFWSDSDGERPKQIILGQMGRGRGCMLFVSGSTGCSSPGLLAI